MNKLREIRLQRKMTQVELAALVNVSQPFLHDLETGRRGAKPETWARIAEALNCKITELKEEKAG